MVTAIWLTVECGTVELSTVRQASFWDYWQLQDGYVAAVDSGKRWMGYIYNVLKIYVGFAWTTCTQLFTSISIQIVLELRLAWRREMHDHLKKFALQQQPNLHCLRKKEISYNYLFTHQEYIRCCKWDDINLEAELADYSSSLPTAGLSFQRYLAVKHWIYHS